MLAARVFRGPDPRRDGVAAWTRADLCGWLERRFGKVFHPSSLWARAPVAGDFAAGFGYTRLDDERAAPPERGMATLFHWGELGEGTAAWPADVPA